MNGINVFELALNEYKLPTFPNLAVSWLQNARILHTPSRDHLARQGRGAIASIGRPARQLVSGALVPASIPTAGCTHA